jgi:hypothetical protein
MTSFSTISVLVPTRRRIERLRTLLASCEATALRAPNVELIFRIDDDDEDTQTFLSGQKFWARSTLRVISGPRLAGYRSMPAFFNELAAAALGDILICGNDDMVFQTADWPTAILAAANEFPDGLFNFGVSTHNETHFPFSTVSRIATERLGFIWDPRIFWGDIYLRDVMSAFGRSLMLPNVQIDHDWIGFAPDAVFRESDKSIPPDYWTSVHAPAVSDAVERLRPLLRMECEA